MAVGFTKDGAVQDQIDDTVNDAVLAARKGLALSRTNTTIYCIECDEEISERRRKAIPRVECCISCQSKREQKLGLWGSSFNRRACKDALLR